MIIVELKNVHFHAFHGLYEEEKKAGNDYEFNLTVSWEAGALITNLNETVNPDKPIARFMNKQELNTHGWQFDHFHLEILKISRTF